MVKSFAKWDIYYLYEYAYSFAVHGDGEPKLICFQVEQGRLCYVVMQRDIADSGLFGEYLAKEELYDWETPYGYGGPLIEGDFSEKDWEEFRQAIFSYCRQEGIMTQFIRFHPLLQNQTSLPNWIETRYLRETIAMDTGDSEIIWNHMDSKNRNMVRKALKNEVQIIRKPLSEYEFFASMYLQTMQRDGATEYYYFKKEFFDALTELSEYGQIFYALRQEQPIAAGIILYNQSFAHYHLSGGFAEGREFSPMNLLLYEAALWASRQGIKSFHLGGGIQAEDNLFRFKKQFNKFGKLPFWVGRTIFDSEKYQELCRIRKQICPHFDLENNYMIQYRR